jgi:hypothetical protein
MKQITEMPGGARLFVPNGVQTNAQGGLALTCHLHGSHEVVQQAFLRSGRPGVLVTLVLPGLSAVYTSHFAKDPDGTFFTLLAAVQKETKATRLDTVWLSSFSAGFGGVRELLRSEKIHQRLDALILADTLYAGFTPGVATINGENGARPVPNPENLTGFTRFAKDAATTRERAMLVTYSALVPPDYSSTAETAEALRQSVGVKTVPQTGELPEDLTMTEHARKGRFATYGFAGDDGPAHMRHLRGLWMFYRWVPRA